MNHTGPCPQGAPLEQLWRERVAQEQFAALRAHPLTPIRTPFSREARLRTEIDMMLVAEAQRQRRAGRVAAFGAKQIRLPPLASPVRAQPPARPFPLLGAHVAQRVASAGSFTSRQMEERGVHFKNLESGTWGCMPR